MRNIGKSSLQCDIDNAPIVSFSELPRDVLARMHALPQVQQARPLRF